MKRQEASKREVLSSNTHARSDRIYWLKDMFTIIIISLLWREGVLCDHVNLLTLKTQGTLCKGENVTLTCSNELSPFTKNIVWSKGNPNDKYSECTTDGICFQNLNDERVSISANETASAVNIYNLSHVRDESKWICCSPEDTCTSIDIHVCSPPRQIVLLINPTSHNIDPDKGLLLLSDVKCVYPNDIDVFIQRRIQGEQYFSDVKKLHDLVPRNGAKDGCLDYESVLQVRAHILPTSYRNLWVEFRFKVTSTNGFEMFSEPTNVLHFPGQVEHGHTLSIGAIAGIVITSLVVLIATGIGICIYRRLKRRLNRRTQRQHYYGIGDSVIRMKIENCKNERCFAHDVENRSCNVYTIESTDTGSWEDIYEGLSPTILNMHNRNDYINDQSV